MWYRRFLSVALVVAVSLLVGPSALVVSAEGSNAVDKAEAKSYSLYQRAKDYAINAGAKFATRFTWIHNTANQLNAAANAAANYGNEGSNIGGVGEFGGGDGAGGLSFEGGGGGVDFKNPLPELADIESAGDADNKPSFQGRMLFGNLKKKIDKRQKAIDQAAHESEEPATDKPKSRFPAAQGGHGWGGRAWWSRWHWADSLNT